MVRRAESLRATLSGEALACAVVADLALEVLALTEWFGLSPLDDAGRAAALRAVAAMLEGGAEQ